jgi:hypothetical protein
MGYPEVALTKKKSRWKRRALITLGVGAVAVPGLWLAIHEIPGFGPAVADGVRWVFGPKVVAWAEDVSYDIQDRYDRWRYKDAAPKTFWEAPSASPVALGTAPPAAPSSAPVAVAASASGAPAAPPAEAAAFPPPAFTPPYENVATAGDGTWVAMKEGVVAEGEPSAMWKSVVHPDPKRGFAAVAIVAMDLRRLDLNLVAGTQEPASTTVPAERRPGVVPKDRYTDLIAAFNGGFKAVHGHWGMMLDGDTLLAPRDIACTVALQRDGSIKIRTFTALKGTEPTMTGYRQTPPCLLEEGKVNNVLESTEYSRNWGATVSGETVIRRSAIGVDKTGRTIFYALGEAMTAQALARAMKAIGAESAAQLDVNYSYPRFLLFEKSSPTDPPRAGSALIRDIKFSKAEYVAEPAPRDFFYVTRHRNSS